MESERIPHMSKAAVISLLVAFGLAAGGCAMAVEVEIQGKEWFVKHIWIMWAMWYAFGLSTVSALYLILRDWSPFRTACWETFSRSAAT